MDAEVTVKAEVKVPLTTGKEATLTLEDDQVVIKTPVSFKLPTMKLADLEAAVGELGAARARVTG